MHVHKQVQEGLSHEVSTSHGAPGTGGIRERSGEMTASTEDL